MTTDKCIRCAGFGTLIGHGANERPYQAYYPWRSIERTLATRARAARGCPDCEGRGTVSSDKQEARVGQ